MMMWRFATLGAAMAASVSASLIEISNMCDSSFDLSHVGLGRVVSVEPLAPGQVVTKDLPPGTASQVFKAGTGGQATLAEISTNGGFLYFDISIIPTGVRGPDDCDSLAACKAHTQGTGFNYPMQMVPVGGSGVTCRTLTCMADGCTDAYLFPNDVKTHTCTLDADLKVIFCPGGTGGATPSPSPSPSPTSDDASLESGVLTKSPNNLRAGAEDRSLDPEDEETDARDQSAASASASAGADADTPAPSSTTATPSATPKASATTSEAESENRSSSTVTSTTKAPESKATEANTQSSGSSSTGAGVYVLSVMGGVAAVAGVAIVVVRRKKQALEAMDDKTPRPPTTTTARRQSAFLLVTPTEKNVSVL